MFALRHIHHGSQPRSLSASTGRRHLNAVIKFDNFDLMAVPRWMNDYGFQKSAQQD
jgi:hypothetical protein